MLLLQVINYRIHTLLIAVCDGGLCVYFCSLSQLNVAAYLISKAIDEHWVNFCCEIRDHFYIALCIVLSTMDR
jgi:hypothetical protein